MRYLFDQGGVRLGEMEDEQLPFNTSLKLVFSSGVEGWGIVLELNPDGTFSGDYSDSNMGEIGEGYLGGTPVNVLSDAFLVWWREYWNMDGTTKKTLTCYGLYNKKMGMDFLIIK